MGTTTFSSFIYLILAVFPAKDRANENYPNLELLSHKNLLRLRTHRRVETRTGAMMSGPHAFPRHGSYYLEGGGRRLRNPSFQYASRRRAIRCQLESVG